MTTINTHMMPTDSSRWSHTLEYSQIRKCPCCDDSFQICVGSVHDENRELLACYMAKLTHHDDEPVVELYLMLGEWFDGTALEGRKVTLLLWTSPGGEIVSSINGNKAFPVDEQVLRSELLASPLRSLIFEIDDFIKDENPYIRPHLTATSAQQGSEQSTSYMWNSI